MTEAVEDKVREPASLEPTLPPEEKRLLTALAAFRIDDVETPAWSFAQRLAREQAWSARYAHRVIVEYKRFLALTALAGHVVCPSEQVDEAWHLHLLYTRSYWKRLCKEVLGRELHHSPSQGGAAEDDKHWRMYEQTLESYRRIFGEPPPLEIWPAPAQRFEGAAARRIDLARRFVMRVGWAGLTGGLLVVVLVLAVLSQ